MARYRYLPPALFSMLTAALLAMAAMDLARGDRLLAAGEAVVCVALVWCAWRSWADGREEGKRP